MTKPKFVHYRHPQKSGYAVCGTPLASNSPTGITPESVTCPRCQGYLIKYGNTIQDADDDDAE